MTKNKYIAPEIEVTSFCVADKLLGEFIPGDGNTGNEGGSETLPSQPEIDIPEDN